MRTIVAAKRTVFGAFLAMAAVVVPTVAQQRPTFRGGVDLVQVDVVVVDAEGRPVRGLTTEDFQILDRGRPQEIAAFNEITHERPALGPLPPTHRLDVADNSTARSDRLIVLILDDLHFQAKTQEVKDMARRVVQELGGQASLALVTTSGTFGVEPTEDRALLLAELEKFIDRYDPQGRRLHPAVQSGVRLPMMPPPPSGFKRGEPPDLATFFGDMAQYQSLEDVAKKIGADDGRRKAFVWISGGNKGPVADPIDGGSPTEWFYLNALGDLLEALRRSSVATYSIDTGDFSSAVLTKVSDLSGGFVMRARDFDRDLGRLISDLDHYYLLGFYPDDASDKGYHALDVRVSRPGLTVRHRRGYKPGGAPAQPKNKTPLARLAAGVLPAADLPLQLQATVLPPVTASNARLAVTMQVRATAAALLEADGTMRDVLRYEVWAVDLKKKKPVRSVAREVRVALRDESPAGATQEIATYLVQTTLAIPAGRYQLRAAATSAKLGKGGSVYLEAEMPDFRNGRLGLGGIVIGFADAARVPIAGNRLSRTVLPVDPALEREFTQSDTLRLFCDVVKAARSAVNAVVDLRDGSGQVLTRIDERRFAALEASRLDLTLPLRDVAPGGYIVRVTATDGTTAAQREVGFVVR